ncbi:MAG: hypothetical protein GDA46_00675 [Bdellovibrionales bacterium]|nr:hypothetical protein [Bdellovibrionales bacterium]
MRKILIVVSLSFYFSNLAFSQEKGLLKIPKEVEEMFKEKIENNSSVEKDISNEENPNTLPVEDNSFQEYNSSKEENPSDEDQSSNNVSSRYNSKTVIFYKKDCEVTDQNCVKKGAMLVNVKSVIFNYYHNRMKFQNKK